MLEAFYEVCEDNNDRFCLGNVASQYCLIFIAFHNTLLQKSILSLIFCGKSDKETGGLPGRPKYNIQVETLCIWFFVGENFENIWSVAIDTSCSGG